MKVNHRLLEVKAESEAEAEFLLLAMAGSDGVRRYYIPLNDHLNGSVRKLSLILEQQQFEAIKKCCCNLQFPFM